MNEGRVKVVGQTLLPVGGLHETLGAEAAALDALAVGHSAVGGYFAQVSQESRYVDCRRRRSIADHVMG